MPNKYFHFRNKFNAGYQKEAIELFTSYLHKELGTDTFSLSNRKLQAGKFDHFEVFLLSISGDNSALLVPFGKLFKVLWDLVPFQGFISLLVFKDLAAPTFNELFRLEEAPEYGDVESVKILPAILEEAFANGTLSTQSVDQRYGGQAVLNLEYLYDVGTEANNWLGLEKTVENLIKNAKKPNIKAYWNATKNTHPKRALELYLYTSFAEHNHKASIVALTWEGIKRRKENGFCELILTSLKQIITKSTEKECLEFVHMDAGKFHVKNGRNWLENLMKCLKGEKNFDILFN